MITRFLAAVSFAALSLLPAATAASAQSFPSRPIRIVVPFDAGGAMDVVVRLIGQAASAQGGPQIVVENKTGGGGVIGTMAVREAAPDGYTLLEGSSSTHVLNPHMMPKFPYDPVKDFQPVTMLVKVPQFLAVPGGSPVRSVADLQELARKKPGGLSYGSAGVGSAPHMTAALLERSLGVPMTHVPYRGMASALTDLIAGRIDFVFSSTASFGGQAADGKIRLLAVAGSHRVSQLPDVPSMAEAGHPGVELDLWFGILAPAGTDPAIVSTLNGIFAKASKDPAVVKRFADMGLEIAIGSPAQFRQAIESENKRLGPFVRELAARPK